MDFKDYLVQWREDANLDDEAAADRLQMPDSRYRLMEKGKIDPRAMELLRISKLYGVPLETVVRAAAKY